MSIFTLGRQLLDIEHFLSSFSGYLAFPVPISLLHLKKGKTTNGVLSSIIYAKYLILSCAILHYKDKVVFKGSSIVSDFMNMST